MKLAAISEIISDILRLGEGSEFILGLQRIETEVLSDHLPSPFPGTFPSDAPTGRGRRIPAGRRRVLHGFRCAGPRQGRCTHYPCNVGSALAELWSWDDSLKSLPFLL